jgi:hypothetical protein
VAAGRRFSGGEDLGYIGGVALGIELFVFILEAPGIFARVAWAPPVRERGGCDFGFGRGRADRAMKWAVSLKAIGENRVFYVGVT